MPTRPTWNLSIPATTTWGAKRVAGVSAADQTITLATPNRWNPKAFSFDWYLSIPTAGGNGQFTNQCYLENALEMLDQPGEWYLDRKSGVLAYWPRAGEDLASAEGIAPAALSTLIALVGTPEKPVRNVHLRGIRCEYLDWQPPAWGYMGLFCCNVATDSKPNPGHRFIDAAVDFVHAVGCSYRDGGVAHVGAMGICLREGTSQITIDGNEVADLGGGGIGLGGCNVAAGYTGAAPPPRPGEYQGYRITNNYVHHCGSDYYGAVGISMYLAQNSLIAHNLIHDTAYFGLCVAGSQAGTSPFAGGNQIEYNHVHDGMKVTIDGAAMYITFAHYNGGTPRPRQPGTRHRGRQRQSPQRGHLSGLRLHRLPLSGKRGVSQQRRRPADLQFRRAASEKRLGGQRVCQRRDAAGRIFGRRPTGRRARARLPCSIAEVTPAPCTMHALGNDSTATAWGAYQYHLPGENRGVIQIVRRMGDRDESLRLKLADLVPGDQYALKAISGNVAEVNVWGPGTMPMLTAAVPSDGAPLGLAAQAAGSDLQETGLDVTLPAKQQLLWIVYARQP